MIVNVKFNNKTYPVSCYGKVMDEYISAFIHSGVFYEEPLLTYLYDNYKFKNVVDVGANIGNHSAFLSKVMGAKVTSFEPIKDNFMHLVKNNDGDNYNVGLGDKEKEMGYVGNNILNGNPNMGECVLTDGFGIKIKTLDSYNLKPDLIKIDVEGMEDEVVSGGIETIKKYKPILVIEHNDIQKLYDTARLLVPLGYKIRPFVEKNWEVFIYEV
jgi:FkbM family methyltransferase